MPYADPLTAATEELAPARATTNFFDPTQGQNVIARYKNARIAAEGADAVAEGSSAIADASSRLNQSRLDRAEARRRATMFDRDERDYAEKQNFKSMRGELAIQLASLDEKAEDYDTVVSGLVAEMPDAALQDDVVKAILSRKNQLRDDHLSQQEKRDYASYTFDHRRQLQQDRVLSKAAEMGLPSDQIVYEEDGSVDVVETMSRAAEAKSTLKKENSLEMIEERARISQGTKAAQVAAKDRKKIMEESVLDQGAFPSQVAYLMKKHDLSETDLKKDYPAEYKEAVAYEAKKLGSERASALARDSADEYADLATKATPAQKEKRREFWRAAKEMVGDIEPMEPGTAPATPKTLTPEARADIMERAGGDPLKAKQIAIEEGY